MFEKHRGGGTPHIPFQGIWSKVQTKVGTLHQIGAARLRSRVVWWLVDGWVGGGWVVGWSNVILDPTLALISAQLGFSIQV